MSRGRLCLALLANMLTLQQASAAYALSPGFMGPDESPGVDAPWMMEPSKKRKRKADDRSVMEVLKQMWGTAEWPPRGKGPNPAQNDLHPMTGMRFGMGLVAFTICFGVGFTVTMGTAARDSRSKFPMHFQALVGAICWRHTHQRAVFMHMIRIAIPTLILFGLSRMQAWLLRQVGRDESQTLLESTGMSPKHIVDGIVEYFLTLAMVYVVMVSMLFFVWHVAAEKQSGFRHLLHVSGLSRSALDMLHGNLSNRFKVVSCFDGSACSKKHSYGEANFNILHLVLSRNPFAMLAKSFLYGCIGAGVLATALAIFIDKSAAAMIKGLVSTTSSDSLSRLQRTYLAAYLCAMMADWLQGPFVYALYASYGFTREENATLFVAGFGSSAVFGTFVGSLADKYGRRNFAGLYCLLYLLSCLTKHFKAYWMLMIGRITGGIATSLLFSVLLGHYGPCPRIQLILVRKFLRTFCRSLRARHRLQSDPILTASFEDPPRYKHN
eukprot:s1988_g7.t1